MKDHKVNGNDESDGEASSPDNTAANGNAESNGNDSNPSDESDSKDNMEEDSSDDDPEYGEEGSSSGEDDVPLSDRVKKEVKSEPPTPVKQSSPLVKLKKEAESSDTEDDMPLAQRSKAASSSKKSSSSSSSAKKRAKREDSSDDDDEKYKPPQKKKSKPSTPAAKPSHKSKDKGKDGKSPSKVKKEEPEVWKWWEDIGNRPEGIKWDTLEHQGPWFPPPYNPLPKHVKFYYEGNHLRLSPKAEEAAVFYAPLLDHEYSTKPVFNKNFLHDWRKLMTAEERNLISDISKCDFRKIRDHLTEEREKRKAMSKEEKKAIKAEKDKEVEKYGMAYMDGYPQKIGNFRIEPPGVFRGRGDHPKMGKLKKRLQPEDVMINCTKGKHPAPPAGHKWKEVRCDNTVTWLASWTENVLGQNKYIMLNPSSKIKGEKDFFKYETARKLKKVVGTIRERMEQDWKSREMKMRQIGVALYFIDKLALRAGNEKDEDSADTVGCCSLRVEHIKLHDHVKGVGDFCVEFDFLGKDSIRYNNMVAVDKRVFKNLKYFLENKKPSDNLFDRLNTTIMNEHLRSLMPGLTAKVFRTYNASFTLRQQLELLTNKKDGLVDKVLSYNRANREVALLCNHQRSVPKTHEKSMETLDGKIDAKRTELEAAKKEREKAKGQKDKEKAERKVQSKKDQLKKLKVDRTNRDENKQIALGTSKLNYLDPRISVAWCKKWEVPIEKVYSKTQRDKFQWAIDMTDKDFVW